MVVVVVAVVVVVMFTETVAVQGGRRSRSQNQIMHQTQQPNRRKY